MSRSFRWRAQCALLGMCCAFSAVGFAAEQVIHVAVDGKDQATGTLADPLSLSVALERLQSIRAAQPETSVRVELAAGDYALNAPLHFTAESSGSETAPVVIAATSGTVRFTGGLAVTQWQPIRDAAALARLNPAAAAAVQVADLRALGVTHFGEWCSRGHEHELHPAPLEVFCNNRPAQLARWPNQGWATTCNVHSRGEQTQLTADPPLTRRWQSLADVWCHGYWEADWSDAWQPVTAVDAQRRLTITRTREIENVRNAARFCVLNVLEELDQPGEWYFDRAHGRLYIWPTAKNGDVTVSHLEHLVTCYGAAHITFCGVQFDTARVCLAEVAGGERINFERCTFRNAGNLAVHITGGYQHAIRQCEICDTGEGAVRVEGGERKTLTACEHEICDNHIQRYARTCHAGRPAIGVHGVGIIVRGNCIHDGPDAAIILQGNEHRVEGNEIHHVCLETADSGAIYLGHDWTERGNVIRGNCLHHLGRFNRRDVMGVYLDDFASGTTVTDNVFFEAGRAIVIGGGRDNEVHRNVVLGGFAAVQVDARGQSWARGHLKSDSPLQLRLQKMKRESVYLERYPQLAELLIRDPARPVGNSITHNVLWCAIGVDVQDRWSREDVQYAANWHWPQHKLSAGQLAKVNKPK